MYLPVYFKPAASSLGYQIFNSYIVKRVLTMRLAIFWSSSLAPHSLEFIVDSHDQYIILSSMYSPTEYVHYFVS